MERNGQRWNRDRGGAVLAGMGIGFIALLAVASIAVDVGRIAFTSTEVQTAAEIAATAGAKKLFQDGNELNVRKDALKVLGDGNKIDQRDASTRQVLIQTGSFDPNSGFHPNNTRAGGLGSPNAVKATVTVVVANLMRGMFGSPTSRISKTAIATFAPMGGCDDHPEIPLVIGDCTGFSDHCYSQSCLPHSLQVPSPSTGWTAFRQPANRNFISDFLPSECGGGGQTPPEVRIGDRISVNNRLNTKQQQDLFDMIQQCVLPKGNRFLAPVVDCTGGTLGEEVIGFVTLDLDPINTPELIVHPAFVEDRPSCPADRNFGTGSVRIVG
jgi:Flp pilus assembly protein TadG